MDVIVSQRTCFSWFLQLASEQLNKCATSQLTLPGDTMGNKGFLKFFGVALLTTMLAACGGGGASFGGGTTGSTGGGSGATGVPGSLAFAPANGAASTVTVGQSIALIAVLTDTAGVPLANKTLNFTSTAGTLSTASGKTDSTGKATVFLKASDQTGSATVSVIEPVTNIGGNTNIIFTAAGAGGITITVAPTAVAPGALASVNAQVTDANHNPVSGQLVNFGFSSTGNSSGGLFTQAQVVTDANGRATTTYQAGPTPGTDTLKASLAGSQSITTSLQVVTGTVQVGSITLALGASSAVANGSMLTSATATVKGPGGAVLTGVTVTFSTSTNVLSPNVSGTATQQTLTAQTDATGVAQVFQVSPKLIGNGTITASTGGFSASQAIVFVAGNVTVVTVSASPNIVAPNGTSTITAQLADTNGNLVGNHAVQFSAPSGQFVGGGLVLNGTTNEQGVVSVSYTAPLSGTVTVTGTAEPEGGSIKNTANVTVNNAAAPVTGVAITAGPSSIPANGSSTSIVRATVTGATGALPNVQVNFTSTAGSLSSSSATTDSNGNATVTLTSTSSTLPITSTITAATGGVSSTTTVAFTANVPNGVTVALTPPTVAINGTTTVRATVLDGSSNPISGVTVDFAVSPNNSHGALSATSAVTNTSGVATITYTAGNNTAGSTVTDTIQASTGGKQGSSALTVTATVQVQSVTLIAGSPDLSSSASTPAQGITLTAIVKDSNNNVVPGVSVQFKALRHDPSSCGSGGALQLVNNGITNAAGQAQAILYTGGDPTNQAIDVTASTGAISSTVVQVTEKGTKLTIDGPASVGLNGTATYTVTLADAGNNPISNRQVQVTSANGNLVSTGLPTQITATTNSSGQITAGYSATNIGTDTVTANLSGCTSASTPAVQTVQVANQNLSIVAPNDGAQIPFATPGTFSLGAAVASGGTGYVAGDVLTIFGGTFTIPARVTVIQVGAGGAITDFSVTNAGTYTALPSPNPTAGTGGSGTGATFTVSQNITVKLTGGTVNGQTITLNTTRGTLSASTVTTDMTGSGVVTATITQSSAAGNSGGAVITATCTSCAPTISASVSVQFNAITPASVTLQSTPSTVAIGGTSAIKATVRDANNNPVANQLVQFTLVDNSGGTLLQSSATTNAAGDANVTYKAGPTSSSLDGVVVTGKVGASVTGTTKLTVGGLALRIVLGTGNTIINLNNTQTQYPYSVLVTDSAGNPPPSGSVVNLKINAVSYQKGHFVGCDTDAGCSQILEVDCSSDPGCGTVGTPPTATADANAFGCFNEDRDLDGILNSAFDLDYNNNGTLEPGNVTSIPASVALDSTGTGQFLITYPKDRALWVQVKLIATITVNGDQGRTEVTFILPGIAGDYGPHSSPPGIFSPYGDKPKPATTDTCSSKPPL